MIMMVDDEYMMIITSFHQGRLINGCLVFFWLLHFWGELSPVPQTHGSSYSTRKARPARPGLVTLPWHFQKGNLNLQNLQKTQQSSQHCSHSQINVSATHCLLYNSAAISAGSIVLCVSGAPGLPSRLFLRFREASALKIVHIWQGKKQEVWAAAEAGGGNPDWSHGLLVAVSAQGGGVLCFA